ncbi:MAG: GxxExxY protein [Brevundimonas sp.]|jgi:GxxExxY protein|uniref:GxxExxY protein n=1 Tax=Brevundimonas albigilva TaxID=1312364 RepID=A0ABY4SPZ3_9CAUL|nr:MULTISPECIES: GxxExxY protein [Brevundimonas]PZU58138.1 MAG: GxxExxY protein [Brevundimonas sp.]URI14755.1 GxxExxY protein [Brevundimonas albigilva]
MHDEHDGAEAVSPEVNRIGRAVMDAAFAVHRELGPGLLESVYEQCLALELRRLRVRVERQIAVPVTFREERIDAGFRLDLLVERQVVVEVKSIDALASIHTAQLLTYLRFSQVRLGYLINFNSVRLKDGFRRLVL